MTLGVVNNHLLALLRHPLSLSGASGAKRATWRQPTPSRAEKRQRATYDAKSRQETTARAEKRQEV
jgi:hypothetical protein